VDFSAQSTVISGIYPALRKIKTGIGFLLRYIPTMLGCNRAPPQMWENKGSMAKGASQAKGAIRTQLLPMKAGEYLLVGKDENGSRILGTYQSLEGARDAAAPFDGTLDIIQETMQEIQLEQQRQRIRSELARKGYKLLHRRKGQYWVMMDQPMTLDQIEQTLAKP
jgi:hypothetical protein